MTITTKDQKLSSDFKAFIMESIHEVLEDPDFGLELTDGFKKKLLATKFSKRRLTPFSEIKNKYY